MAAGLACAALPAPAALPPAMAATPAGWTETGVPAFVVLGPEALGLSAPPTDLQVLPDGRILAVAPRELAFGDGARWETFRQAPDDPTGEIREVAVDALGRLYGGVTGGFARIDFGEDAHWRLTRIAALPAGVDPNRAALVNVTTAGDRWFWHTGSGAVVEWRPGREARLIGEINDLDHGFAIGDQVYFSDRSNGALLRAAADRFHPVFGGATVNIPNTVTRGVRLRDGRVVLGTHGRGLVSLEPDGLHPFAAGGMLGGAHRINDLCATTADLTAAALDSAGIAFFDPRGRVVQVLDRSLDHRLARVQRLVYTAGGVLWGLLGEGVVRVEFPSRLSRFDPLVSTGLTHALPCRVAGQLWLLSDGKAHRAVFDADRRLTRFEIDTPPVRYICSLSTATGRLLAGTTEGIYEHSEAGWRLVVPGAVNAHILPRHDGAGRWLFAAMDETGWFRPGPGDYEVERCPAPGLGEVFGGAADHDGTFWVELGASRVARIEPRRPAPLVEVFDRRAGLSDGWAQVFVLDGTAYFNLTGRILDFDPVARRFRDAKALLERYPQLGGAAGRPVRDTLGRLWIASPGAVQVLDDASGRPVNVERMPPGRMPIYFIPEEGGVVWMHEKRHLLRFDPAMPDFVPAPPRALITRVHLIGSNRTVFQPGERLPPLPYADNSLTIHFVAPGTPAGQAVTLEFLLEGTGEQWTPTGIAGSAVFNHLKEGRYVLRVRPVAGGEPGREARLEWTIRPPWHRTPAAYVLFGAAGLGFLALLIGVPVLLERRGRARLEALVADRTRELNDTNLRLAEQVDATLRQAGALREGEERYRRLSNELELRVRDRTRELNQMNERLASGNRELEAFSYSISHDLRAPLRNISGFVDLLRRRTAGRLDAESARFLGVVSTEAVRLSRLIDSLLEFSRLNRGELRSAPVALRALVEAALADLRPEFDGRAVEWRLGDLPVVAGDATLLRQVFENLLTNALKFTRTRPAAVIELGTLPDESTPGHVIVFVRDNGVGFDPKYTHKLFGVFQRLHRVQEFEGTGIGLANTKRIVVRHGGRIWAEGRLQSGATFFVSLPVPPPPPPAGAAPAPTGGRG